MAGIVDRNRDTIGLYSWWRQPDGKEFVVVGYQEDFDTGISKAVKIVGKYNEQCDEIEIDKFIRLMDAKKIIRL